jgi:signal transduction histidine kinase
MGAWFDGFLQLLASETGNLTYHLVLSLSIVFALFLTIMTDTPQAPVRRRRTVFGLALLLLAQFGLFAASFLTWQAMFSGQVLLPPLDRAATLLGLVVIVWLWCFPDSSPVGDAGSILLGLLVVVGMVFSTLTWANQPDSLTFNGTMVDIEAAILGVSVAALGMLALLAIRVDGYWFGFGMLAIMAAGFGLHLAFLPYGGDYPSLVRVGQMVAFPFLALLTQRFLAPAPDVAAPLAGKMTEQLAGEASPRAYQDPLFWQDLARLSAETDPTLLARHAAAMLTATIQTDFCVFVSAPDASGDFHVLGAYDRVNRRYPEVKVIAGQSMPVVTTAWRNVRSRRITAGSAAPDLTSLAAAFALEKIASLLFHPILAADGKARLGVFLISLEASKDWDEAEQEFLTRIAKLVVQFLQRNQEMARIRDDLAQARQTARLGQDQAQQALDEKQRLQSRLAVLNEDTTRDRTQIATLTATAAAHEIALQTIQELQAENERLKESSQQIAKKLQERDLAREGEMRLALQELALMQQNLYEADTKISALKTGRVDVAPSQRQFETIAAIAKEMRQFLASMKNNQAQLLDDVGDQLDARQRKRIQRTNSSVERLDNLIDELGKAITPESNLARLEFEEVNVRDLVQQAVVEGDARLHMRRVSVKLDFSQNNLKVISDRHALKTILNDLLENAGTATPEGGQVMVRARAETRENEEDYVLIQVADSGAGIPATEFVRVFTPRSLGALEDKPIPGLGKSGADLPQLKSLVEALGGYTWVDSVLGRGATFSVLLPAAPVEQKNGRKPSP